MSTSENSQTGHQARRNRKSVWRQHSLSMRRSTRSPSISRSSRFYVLGQGSTAFGGVVHRITNTHDQHVANQAGHQPRRVSTDSALWSQEDQPGHQTCRVSAHPVLRSREDHAFSRWSRFGTRPHFHNSSDCEVTRIQTCILMQ